MQHLLVAVDRWLHGLQYLTIVVDRWLHGSQYVLKTTLKVLQVFLARSLGLTYVMILY